MVPTTNRTYPWLYVIPYLGLYNAQDFAQVLYLVGRVRIIKRNNVFHSFPDRKITCPPCFFVYYILQSFEHVSFNGGILEPFISFHLQ
jgi:hypothetical protein